MIEITDHAANVLFDLLENHIAGMEDKRDDDGLELWTQLDQERFDDLCNIRKHMIKAGCF